MSVFVSQFYSIRGMNMERPRKQYNVQLEDEVVERIDKRAATLDLPRSQVMRNLIMVGLEDAEILNKTGVIPALKLGRDIRNRFIEDFIKGKLRLDKKGGWKITK